MNRVDRPAPRTFRILLRLYPRRYRDRFGADMAVTFDARRRDARAHGRVALLALWGRTTLDITRAALAERWRSLLDGPAVGANIRSTAGPSPEFRPGHGLLGDLRFGVRVLLRAPGYTVFATLAPGARPGCRRNHCRVQRRGSGRPSAAAVSRQRSDGSDRVEEGRRQHLDRHVAAEPRVGRPPDLAHAAFAKRGNDSVRADRITGLHRVVSLASASGQRRPDEAGGCVM